jgi:hypothetical protein
MLYFRYARVDVKRSFLISNVSSGNEALCRGNTLPASCELRKPALQCCQQSTFHTKCMTTETELAHETLTQTRMIENIQCTPSVVVTQFVHIRLETTALWSENKLLGRLKHHVCKIVC